jgi:hypothetical protein
MTRVSKQVQPDEVHVVPFLMVLIDVRASGELGLDRFLTLRIQFAVLPRK